MDLRSWGFYLPILHFWVSECVSASKVIIRITIPKANYIKQTESVSSKHTTNRIPSAIIVHPISHGSLPFSYA